MPPAVVRRFFPGTNTSQGFFSYFPYVWRSLEKPSPARVWIIKGGPGTGKSVLMKRIADDLAARGYAVELHHCCAAPDSLDGIAVPALGAAIVDGTPPHVVEPAVPGAVEEIVNLGDYWDARALRERRGEIEALRARARGYYEGFFRYLQAAAVVHDEWRAANAAAQDWGRVHQAAWGLITDLLRGKAAGAPGFVRKLFASSITPEGPRHFLDSLIEPLPRRIVLVGEPGTGKSAIVTKLAQALTEHGIDLELFHCALRPEEPEHLIAPELGLAVVSSEEPHEVDARRLVAGEGNGAAARVEVIDLQRFQKSGERERQRERAETARAAFWDLLERAVDRFRQGTEAHGELEKFYSPHMDFERVEARRRELVEEMLSLAGA